jgi:hypothetical protein
MKETARKAIDPIDLLLDSSGVVLVVLVILITASFPYGSFGS